MKLSEILPRFHGVRKTGNGYIAKCPSHDDEHQSLSLGEDDGRVLLNCFAGCTAVSIMAQVGLEWQDLFDKRITKPSTHSLGASQYKNPTFPGESVGYSAPQKHIHTIYPYRDENGQLLYENVRYFPKDFRQRHFDEKGNPIWSLHGVRKVPYRLPELIAGKENDADIFLCEGEKDTDTLRELGLTATNLKNWTREFNTYVENSHVVIMQDHDRPGVEHANRTARVVSEAAKSVRVVDLFADRELPERHGPDVSDYVRTLVQDEGLSREEIVERLIRCIGSTPEWKDIINLSTDSLFRSETGNAWIGEARNTPVPRMLFGEFWFEGELCILFADTNVGKSILAMQIADAISRGASIDDILVESAAQKVLYFDFELTAKQFESRFAVHEEGADFYSNHYRFSDNFLRAEINPNLSEMHGFKSFEELLNYSLDKAVVDSGAKVLIVDNLTYLRDETENARNALPLMKYLKELKSKHGLSILALAHTPKRDSSKPLTRNDLQGSKMLINFCDSSFAIGESTKDPELRYLKQIKARNTELIYHANNVKLGVIRKPDNFLGFHFMSTGCESEHLKPETDKEKAAKVVQVQEMIQSGKSQREIAKALGISKTSVMRYMQGH